MVNSNLLKQVTKQKNPTDITLNCNSRIKYLINQHK